jgi:hypothetical protein
VEEQERYVLRIEWKSAQEHLQGFRKEPGFKEFFRLVQRFVDDIEEKSALRTDRSPPLEVMKLARGNCRLLRNCLCGLAALSAGAQQAPRPVFQPFRYDEDWTPLADASKHVDWLDRLKYIPLGPDMTIGGEVRERFELLDQPNFGAGPEDDNGYFLQRYLLSSDFHLGSSLRVFTELQSWT